MGRPGVVVRTLMLLVALTGLTSLAAVAAEEAEPDFVDRLEAVDQAIRKNPGKVSSMALESCLERRNFAAWLYSIGHEARAERSLKYCEHVLGDYRPKKAAAPTGPTMEQIQARAAREVERALDLEPDLKNGLKIYRECALCHMPEGWGLQNGSVPQLAGQHWKVVVKQLADMRAGNRDNLLMLPYASVEAIGGPQAVADVAGYIETLEMTVDGDKGSGEDLERGERLYAENCVSCHGPEGEGDNDRFIPRIQAQHYDYLVRQFEWIRNGKRRNSNPEMVAQIQGFDDAEMRAVLDYVSRLEPPKPLQAPPDWHNPDFVD
jgi:cytochrome c553